VDVTPWTALVGGPWKWRTGHRGFGYLRMGLLVAETINPCNLIHSILDSNEFVFNLFLCMDDMSLEWMHKVKWAILGAHKLYDITFQMKPLFQPEETKLMSPSSKSRIHEWRMFKFCTIIYQIILSNNRVYSRRNDRWRKVKFIVRASFLTFTAIPNSQFQFRPRHGLAACASENEEVKQIRHSGCARMEV